MYFCCDILSKPKDASFDMESPLVDKEMDADGDFKNVKVLKKKEYLNSFIPRTFATRTPSCEASKGYY
jgi:hypothetical protein